MQPPRPMVGEQDRLTFIDVARGWALVLMVVNHTARYWLDDSLGPARWTLIYLTTTLAGPTFLFLVGFVLPLARARAEHPVRNALARAARLLAAGYLLNAVVFPEQPLLGSNVLHTIAFATLAALLVLPWLDAAGARPALLGVAVASTVAFWTLLPGVERWVAAHPRAAQVMFYDFPPWPWLSLVLLGMVAGSVARDRRRLSRLVAALAVAGAAGMLAAVAWWGREPRPLEFTRDIVLNEHWIPRGVTVAWVLGGVAVFLGLAWWLTAVRRLELRWLVVLGRTALALYVIHHLIVVNLGQHALGVRLTGWWEFWAATTGLIAALVVIGMAWLAARSTARKTAQRLYTPAHAGGVPRRAL